MSVGRAVTIGVEGSIPSSSFTPGLVTNHNTMTYTKEDLNSDIPRIRRKAHDYFEAHGLFEGEEKLVNYEDLTKAELKELLEEKGLPVSGLKSELIERLEDNE